MRSPGAATRGGPVRSRARGFPGLRQRPVPGSVGCLFDSSIRPHAVDAGSCSPQASPGGQQRRRTRECRLRERPQCAIRSSRPRAEDRNAISLSYVRMNVRTETRLIRFTPRILGLPSTIEHQDLPALAAAFRRCCKLTDSPGIRAQVNNNRAQKH